MPTAFVTGGSGLIGDALVRGLGPMGSLCASSSLSVWPSGAQATIDVTRAPRSATRR